MTILSKAYLGIAWSALGGGVQLLTRFATFILVASQLAPVEIGAFAIAGLVVGLTEVFSASPFGDSLQQRKEVGQEHLNSTFFLVLATTLCFAASIIMFAPVIASAFSSPNSTSMMIVLAAVLPTSSISVVNDAILARQLRFDAMAKAGSLGALISGATAITGISLGLGVWSLVLAEVIARLFRLFYLWHATKFVPNLNVSVTAFRDLGRFNIHSLLTYILASLDSIAPRALTGLILGPAAVGYLVIAQRFMELLGSLVLDPLSSVTMASVAKLQTQLNAVRKLVLSLYRLAALFGYPIFIGAALVIPDLLLLFGAKWAPAILVAQLLLLRGIRLTTGVFNIAILRGLGHTLKPLILLSCGLALNIILIPIGSIWGLTGVAVAMLLRTFLTWPLGAYFVKIASSLSISQQLVIGTKYLFFSAIMSIAVIGVLNYTSDASNLSRLLMAITTGATIYICLVGFDLRQQFVSALNLLKTGRIKLAFRTLFLDGGI